MDNWKQITIKANIAFEQHNHSLALKHYLAACERATQLLPHWFDRKEALVVLSISYQNLADLYKRLNDPKHVFLCYQTLIMQLQAFAADTTDDELTLRHLVSRIRTDLLLAIKQFDLVDIKTDRLMADVANLSTYSLDQLLEENYP